MVSIVTTLVLIIAGAVELWRQSQKPGGLDEEILAAFVLVAGYILVEKFLAWKEGNRLHALETNLRDDLTHLRDDLAHQRDLLLKVGDVRTLGNSSAGLQHLTRAMKDSNTTAIRDIIVRSSEGSWYTKSSEYLDFLKAKKKFIDSGKLYLMVGNERGLRQLVEAETQADYAAMHRAPNYQKKFVDLAFPICNPVIIEYKDLSKEVLFGWSYDDLSNAYVFQSRDANVVSYFSGLFDSMVAHSSTTPPLKVTR
jgi:hypothetical protein